MFRKAKSKHTLYATKVLAEDFARLLLNIEKRHKKAKTEMNDSYNAYEELELNQSTTTIYGESSDDEEALSRYVELDGDEMLEDEVVISRQDLHKVVCLKERFDRLVGRYDDIKQHNRDLERKCHRMQTDGKQHKRAALEMMLQIEELEAKLMQAQGKSIQLVSAVEQIQKGTCFFLSFFLSFCEWYY